MCGILGSINVEFGSEELDLIKHRGPDSFGLEEFKCASHTVRLGHRRLAIVDLSPAGYQPMVSTCKRYGIIFNGEVYNHEELRNELEGIEFNGHSDTETILYYLIEKGEEGIKRLNGIFAIAFFDFDNNKCLLARDPHGVKPLYYRLKEDSIVFSSEMRPVKKFSSKNIDKDSLASLLKLRYNLSPETLLEDIKKVRPGHILQIDFSDKILKSKEESFLPKPTNKIKLNYHEAIQAYGKELEQAVKRQLMSDVEVGVLLSGGVDSAVVAALAQQQLDYRMKAFTVGFVEDDDSNEIDDAAETAQILGLDHHVVKIGFDDFIGTLKKCSEIVEEPIATTSFIPMYYLSELAAKHVKVVLSGQGADEPLGGYHRYQGEIVKNIFPDVFFNIAVKLFKNLPSKSESIIRGLSSLGIKNDLERFERMYSIFSNEEIQRLIGGREFKSSENLEYLYDALECDKIPTSVEKMMAIDARANLADDLLMYSDKITMNFSLENRVPMLDLKLMRYMESLPSNYKVKFRKGKLVHRDFARQLLPAQIIDRPKKGFKSPTKIWFTTNKEYISSVLLDGNTRFSEVFNINEVKDILDKHSSGYNMEKQIFLLLSLRFWMELNI